jgi:hypothetical protein
LSWIASNDDANNIADVGTQLLFDAGSFTETLMSFFHGAGTPVAGSDTDTGPTPKKSDARPATCGGSGGDFFGLVSCVIARIRSSSS